VFFATSDSHHVRGHLEKLCREKSLTKIPSGNAWCFFAPSDSRHVRAQASGKIASRKIVCWPALAAGLGGARLPAARSQRSCN
jgi:hypothetical protein